MNAAELDTHSNPKGSCIARPPYRAWIGPVESTHQHTMPSGDTVYLTWPTTERGRYVDFDSLPEAVKHIESYTERRHIFLEHQYAPGEWMVLPKDPGLRAWS